MIYYIYKVRRKQTSIRFSCFTLLHRYLRSISWVRRPQAATSWVSTRAPPCATAARRFRGGAYTPKAAIAATLPLLPPGEQANALRSFPEKKKNICLPFFPHSSHTPFLPRCSARELFAHTIRGSSAVGLPSASAASLQTKNAGPRHCAANPQKCRLLAQENARRHAWLTRSCFGRKNLFIDGPHCPFSFLLFYKGKEKENRSKFSRFEYIARTHFVRPHDVRDWPRASSAETKVAKSTDFCFIFESLPISLQDLARNSIGKCSWHIKDHCLGVNKASRVFLYFCVSFFSQNLSP